MIKTYIGVDVKYSYYWQILMKLEFSGQIFEKYSTTKLHDNSPLEGELIHAEGRTDGRTDGQADRQIWGS
jgi:hypothetical protein